MIPNVGRIFSFFDTGCPSHLMQLPRSRRSTRWNSSQNSGSSMNSLRFQSATTT